MPTRVITFCRVHETSLTTTDLADSVRLHFEIMFILKAIKAHFKESYDKKDLTQEVIHMNFMKFAKGLFHKFHMK